MPYTESGVWIPTQKPELWWKKLGKGFTLPIVLSIASLFISSGSFWLTRRNTEIAQRAYLGVQFQLPHRDKLLNFVKSSGSTFDFLLNLQLTNSGNSPANDVNTSIDWKLGLEVENAMHKEIIPFSDKFDIGPKETASIELYRQLSSEIVARALINKALKIVVAGRVTYSDVFGQRHEQPICQRITVDASNDNVNIADCRVAERMLTMKEYR